MPITPPRRTRRTRRTHSEEFKRFLIDACGEPGVSVAGSALANGINANRRGTRMKVLIHDGQAIWLACRRLH